MSRSISYNFMGQWRSLCEHSPNTKSRFRNAIPYVPNRDGKTIGNIRRQIDHLEEITRHEKLSKWTYFRKLRGHVKNGDPISTGWYIYGLVSRFRDETNPVPDLECIVMQVLIYDRSIYTAVASFPRVYDPI